MILKSLSDDYFLGSVYKYITFSLSHYGESPSHSVYVIKFSTKLPHFL